MPATHKKLTIGSGTTAGQATAYLADPQATGDYYSEAAHAFMRWVASPRARSVLGLNQEVELWKVERLMNGQHPSTGKSIRRWGSKVIKDRETGELRRETTLVAAHDVTVSPAPKSVSIVWALADDELRREIEVMVGQAADLAFRRMLRRVPLIKERYGPGANDLRVVKADDYVAIEALHTTARLTEAKPNVPDPDLHLHCVVFGAVNAKGGLTAIDSLQIRKYRGQLGAHGSAELAEMFRLRGWQLERRLETDAHGKVKGVHWELAGVPGELIKAMSTRSQEIDHLKQKYRELYGLEPDGVGFEEFLLKHRGPKSKRSSEELRREWITEGRSHGYGPEQVAEAQAQAVARQAAGIAEASESGPEAEQLRQEILADLTREHALVPTRELYKLAMQRAQGLIDPIAAQGVVAEMFGNSDILMTADGSKVTTLATLALEQRAIRAAGQLLEARQAQAAQRERLEAEFQAAEEDGNPFDEAQREAIALAVSGASFVSIAGPAGTGKGFASHAAVNIWHDQGRRVIALAVAGRTAQQAQVDAETDLNKTIDQLLARIEHGLFRLDRNDVVYVDEAAMIDHHRYADLLEATAEAGATYVQVGDDKQLSPVEAGGLWTVVHQMADDRGLATELETIRRARNPTEAQAWTDLRYGEVEKALNWYRDQGRLHLYENRADLLHGLVTEWWSSNPEGVMVIDTTNLERDSANRLAQAKRLEAGKLGEEAMALINGREVRVGDRVITNEIHHLNRDLNSHGPRIENGTVATVRALQEVELDYRGSKLDSERGLKQNALLERHGYSQLDSQRQHAVPGLANVAVLELHEPAGSRVIAVDASVPLELAYARHVYKAQGMSTEVANIATGPSTSRERAYVMASRSREGTHIHAVAAELEENWETRVPDLEPAAEQEAVSAPVQAEAPVTASQIIADIDAVKAERDAQAATEWEQARSDATIREIAQAAKSEAKQAIHDPDTAEPAQWTQPAEPEHVDHQLKAADRHDRAHWLPEFGTDYELNPRSQAQPHHDRATSAVMRQQLTSEESRANTRQRLAERLEANQDAVRQQGRVPAPMPAREPMETIARGHAERGNTTELLALYRTVDRLEMAQDPERAAIEHAEPGGLIIAQDQAQRDRLRGLLQERQQAQRLEVSEEIPLERATHQAEVNAPELASVITAQNAYSQRAARREQWVQQTLEARQGQQGRSEAFEHHVEPGAIERATVVVSDPKDAHALSRGLSGAAQARLVTGQPDPVTAQAVDARASEIRTQQQARAEQESQQQAEHVQEAQQQQATQRTQEAQPAARQAEHQGAER